jgi:hypothetical protein
MADAPRPATVDGLPAHWRARAEELRPIAPGAAYIYDQVALELERALRQAGDEVLNLRQAARESGYSEDYLGRLLKAGKLANAGRPGAPKIRRGDLPRKATRVAAPVTDAQFERVAATAVAGRTRR